MEREILECGCVFVGALVVERCPRCEYLFSSPEEGGFELFPEWEWEKEGE